MVQSFAQTFWQYSLIFLQDKDWCDEYEACKLVGLTGVDASADNTKASDSNNIDDLCNSEVSSNKELFLNCRQKCQERSCCFEVGENAAYSCYQAVRKY